MKITKVIVFFEDGSFQEVAPTSIFTPPAAPLVPNKYGPLKDNRCLCCGDPRGHGDLPCPNLRPYSLNTTGEIR